MVGAVSTPPRDTATPPRTTPVPRPRPRRHRPGFLHNVLAHPLLVLCPPLGEWLHARTRP